MGDGNGRFQARHVPVTGRLDPERIGSCDGWYSGEQSVTQNCSCEAQQPHFKSQPSPSASIWRWACGLPGRGVEVEVTRRGGEREPSQSGVFLP